MFYTAEALLGERDLHFSKHGAVHAAFGQHFAKPGVLDAKFHRWMLDAFDNRIAGDYGVDAVIEPGEVEKIIRRATEFLDTARQYLESRR